MTLSLAGTWLGHTAEYVRVWGTRGLGTELVGSVHAYMIPLAVLLGVVGLLMTSRLWRLWVELGHRLDRARHALHTALRGKPVPPLPGGAGRIPSVSSRVLAAWPALTLLQLSLYLVQENLEAAAAGTTAPGLGAITGVHALAPLVHAVVALALLLALALALRLMRRRARSIEAVERIVRLLFGVRRGRALSPAPPARSAATPLQLFGCDLLQRPPPLPATL